MHDCLSSSTEAFLGLLDFDTSQFMPHGHCILWKPQLLFPIVIADVLTFIAYTSIPIALFIFQRKRNDLTKNARLILILFFLFIQACGITHLISAYNYWHSEYIIEMFFKCFTALISVITAVALFRLIPQFLAIPSPDEHLDLIKKLKDLNKNLEEKVSERTKTIEEQKSLLSTLVEGQQGAILEYHPKFDKQGNLIDFSNSIVFGNPHEEVGFEDEQDILTDSILEDFPEAVENGHFDSAVKSFKENSIIINDPIYYPVTNKYFRVITFKKPTMNTLFVYLHDVTEREITKINMLNNAKLISLGELAGGIAHEINTPLQLITGNARRLERQLETSDEKTKYVLKTIKDTVNKISSIVQNLKSLAGGDSAKITDTDVTATIERTLSLYEQRLSFKQVKVSKNYDKSVIAKANEVSLFQIISNLISNAIDAFEDSHDDKQITISIEKMKNKVVLEVSNNGPLINQDIVDKIFDPLFTTKGPDKGTGFGLSLSKRLSMQMNGDLNVHQDDRVRFRLTMKV